jgi:hypothetical protein
MNFIRFRHSDTVAANDSSSAIAVVVPREIGGGGPSPVGAHNLGRTRFPLRRMRILTG